MRNVILMSALLTMAGCALNSPESLSMWHYRHNPAMSEAMNVALAVGLTDGKAGTLRDGYRDPRYVANVDDIVNYGQTAPGLDPSGMDATIDVETGLLGDSSLTDDQSTPHIYVFMPRRKASNGYDAATRLQRMVDRAMSEALTRQGFRAQLDKPNADGSFVVTGGHCEENGIHCTVGSSFNYLTSNVLDGSRWDGGVLVDKGPEFVGGGPVWFFRGSAGFGVLRDADHRHHGEMDNGEDTPGEVGMNMTRLYRDTSHYLPSWVYIYDPYDPDSGGRPVIFTAGKTLRFISPAAHTAARESMSRHS